VKTIIAAPFKDAISVGMKGEGLPGFEYLTNITSRVSRWSTGIHSRQTPPSEFPYRSTTAKLLMLYKTT
jgi:hypothetical protein